MTSSFYIQHTRINVCIHQMLRIDFFTNNWYNQTQNDIHMNLENPAFLHIAQCMISYNCDISSANKIEHDIHTC